MSADTCPFILHGDSLQHVFENLEVVSLCTAVQERFCAAPVENVVPVIFVLARPCFATFLSLANDVHYV